MPRVLIAGYYGHGNTGDEAILAAMLSDLRSLRSDLRFVVVSGEPAATARQHEVEAVLVSDIGRLVEAVRDAQLVILGGGGLFEDYWGSEHNLLLTRRHAGLAVYAGFPLLATLADIPCMLYAVGVGPLLTDGGRRLTRLAFEMARVATVRDSESRDTVERLGVARGLVRVTADPAFRIRPDNARGRNLLEEEGVRRDGPVVALCLRHWEVGPSGDAWQVAVANAVERFAVDHDASLVFVPLQSDPGDPSTHDPAVAAAVAARLPGVKTVHVLRQRLAPDDVASLLSACDLVLGMRLHSVVFAATAGVPVVGLVYDPKVAHLMTALGVPTFALDLPSMTTDAVAAALRRAWAERERLAVELSAHSRTLRERALENARVAIGLLEQPPPASEDSVETLVKRVALRQTSELACAEERAAKAERELAELRAQLAAMTRSAEWRMVSRLRRARGRLAPPGTWRDGLLRAGFRMLQESANHGTTGFFRAGRDEMRTLRRAVVHRLRAPRPASAAPRAAARTRGTFIVLSGVPIDDTGGGQRATQLALELLHREFTVVFLSKFPRQETADAAVRIRHPNLFADGVRRFDLAHFLRGHPHVAEGKPVVAVTEAPLPEFVPIVSAIRAAGGTTVYDLLDAWETSLGQGWYSIEAERRIIADSEILLGTAPSLLARLERLAERPVVLMPNAVNLRLFDRRRAYSRPRDLPEAAWIMIYVGALWGAWFDWDLVVHLAERHADAAVVVIGDYRGQCAAPPKNLRFLGLRAQHAVPAYLAHATVGIVPWRVDGITRSTSPLKVYEYLAMGKPVVAPDLPTLAGVPFVLRSPTADDFAANVERGRSLVIDAQGLDAFLHENSWEARVDRLLALATGASPAASRETPTGRAMSPGPGDG